MVEGKVVTGPREGESEAAVLGTILFSFSSMSAVTVAELCREKG